MKIAFFDSSEENRKMLRDWLNAYSGLYNKEFDVLWFSRPVIKEILRKYTSEISLAYISLDEPWGFSAGEILYALNSECRICYYSSGDCALYPLLCTRPIDFFCTAAGKAKFLEIHHGRVNEILNAGSVVVIDTRKQTYCIPSAAIEYIQSNLKYVDFIKQDGDTVHVFYKLSEVEGKLDGRFLRIHKSYIINIKCVMGIDKESHTISMHSGAVLPISNPYYKQTLSLFQKATTI